MNYRFHKILLLGALLLAGSHAALHAQGFSVPWFVAADGGGTTEGGIFSMTGTFGQWDANEQALTNGIFSLTGGFWSFLADDQTEVFTGDLGGNAGNTIDPTQWTTSGDTVIETNGVMEILNNAANNGGVLTSVPFIVNGTGLITITREVLLHSQTNANGSNYFMGQFGITIGALPTFSVYYADMDYADGVVYLARDGFFLARDGQSPLLVADQSKVSAAIAPLWDTWFNETVTYDPTTGVMQYFINDVLQATFNAGVLPPVNSTTMTLLFTAWGQGTGHYQDFQDLLVTQAPATASSTAAISLSGNLAFGGVTVNTTSNLTFTISNAGNATLTVTNISYPTGFSGVFAGDIAAGASTNVTVTFSPTPVTNNYGGTVVVGTAETGVSGSIPISGYVASGTLKLVININGKGTVSPNLTGKTLAAGAVRTIKAIAGKGAVFSGWSGSIITNKNPLTFTMETSTLLQANFETSPFTPAEGTYNGLFAMTSGVTEETAGMLKGLAVTQSGTYSGTLLIDGKSHPLIGIFDATGHGSNFIAHPTPLIVEMTLDLSASPPQITGTVSNAASAWVANLAAYRATNDGSAHYTMVLAPTEFGRSDIPPGYGYVLITKHNGVLALSGALADGAALTQTVPVLETGDVPVYASLYNNTGLLMGWVNMANDAPFGMLNWIKKAAPHPLLYKNGFTNLVIAQGATWINQTPAINLSAGQLNIVGGTLAAALTFDVAVSQHNTLTKISNSPANTLTGSINPKTGLLTVTFGTGVGHATTVGKGAVLQNTTNAAGYFLGTTNAGSVILEP